MNEFDHTAEDRCDVCRRVMEWKRLGGPVFACCGCGTTTAEDTFTEG